MTRTTRFPRLRWWPAITALALAATACTVEFSPDDSQARRNIEALHQRPTSGVTNEPVADGDEDFVLIMERLATVIADAFGSGDVELLRTASTQSAQLRFLEVMVSRGQYYSATEAEYSVESVDLWHRLADDRAVVVTQERWGAPAHWYDVWTDEVVLPSSWASEETRTSLVLLERGPDLRWRVSAAIAVLSDAAWASDPQAVADRVTAGDHEVYPYVAGDGSVCALVVEPLMTHCVSPSDVALLAERPAMATTRTWTNPAAGKKPGAIAIVEGHDHLEVDGTLVDTVAIGHGLVLAVIEGVTRETKLTAIAPDGETVTIELPLG
ncbi:MAG: hypothetical protein R2733_04285 [Acidimicrobiales bacterium]